MINIRNDEEEYKDKATKEGIERVKEKYKKRWGIKDKDRDIFYINNKKGSKGFPSLEEAPVGETWEDEHGKEWKRVDENYWIKQSAIESYRPDKCMSCKRLLSNKNEINVHMATGKCYKCHAKEEKMKIINKEKFEDPNWEQDILIRDSFGNIIMNIDEYRQQYGDLNTYIFLTNLIWGMNRKKEEGKNINIKIYNNANNILNEIKKERLEDINILNDIISNFKEKGIIKNTILDPQVKAITKEFHKQKGNAKELEIINKKREDFKKYTT